MVEEHSGKTLNNESKNQNSVHPWQIFAWVCGGMGSIAGIIFIFYQIFNDGDQIATNTEHDDLVAGGKIASELKTVECNTESYLRLDAGTPNKNSVGELEVCWPKNAGQASVVAFIRDSKPPNQEYRRCLDRNQSDSECPIGWSSAEKISAGPSDNSEELCETWRFRNWLANGARDVELRVENCSYEVAD